MSHISSTDTLKSTVVKWGIFFGGNSSNSILIITFEKRTLRIIAGVKSRNLFMRLYILPLPCEYTFTLMNVLVNNQEIFQETPAIHNVNTWNMDHLHRTIPKLSRVQSSVHNHGIRIFNSLSSNPRSLMNKKAQVKGALKRYLNAYITLLKNS